MMSQKASPKIVNFITSDKGRDQMVKMNYINIPLKILSIQQKLSL
jgi:hypothetical protein